MLYFHNDIHTHSHAPLDERSCRTPGDDSKRNGVDFGGGFGGPAEKFTQDADRTINSDFTRQLWTITRSI